MSKKPRRVPSPLRQAEEDLEAGYRAEAADEAAEQEALEWIEALIGDALPDE